MSPRPKTRPNSQHKQRRAKRSSLGLLHWWPMLLAVAATLFAVRAASVLALTGPVALRMLYPSIALWQAHAPGALTPGQQDATATALLWLQFPVYGLLLVLFSRARRVAAGVVCVLLLHGLLCLGTQFWR